MESDGSHPTLPPTPDHLVADDAGSFSHLSPAYQPSLVSDASFQPAPGAAAIPPYDDLLIPPLNFGRVCRGVYRSGFPGRKNFHFLRKLGIGSVVNLSEHEYPPETLDHFHSMGIKSLNLMVKGNKEPFQSSDEDVISSALHMVLDATPDRPLLLHCTKGTHRTGCVVGCLRKLEGWSLATVFDEYRRYAGTKVHLLDQQFIEFFTPTAEHREKERKTRKNR